VSIVDLLRALRKRWRVLVVVALIVEGLFALFVAQATSKYTATSQLYVTSPVTNPNAQYQQQIALQSLVSSLVSVVDKQPVLEPVVTKLGLPYSWQHLAGEVSASAPLNSVLINVSVVDPSPERAGKILAAVDQRFSTYAAQLSSLNGSPSTIKVTEDQPPVVSGSPTSPKVVLDLVIGALLGLAAGVAAALLRDALDTTVKSAEDISDRFRTVALGEIPFDRVTPKHPIATERVGQGARVEAFRQLRTNLQFVQIDEQPRSILVTSSLAYEGKSTTACNLAVALAQIGVDVILVDGDLRHPKVAQYLGVEPSVGLTSVLIGWTHWSEVLQDWGNEQFRLRVLAAGPMPPNPSELVAGEAMDRLLTELEDACDVVIIDGPPLLPVADSAVLGASASGTLLVVRQGKTRFQELARAINALEAVDARLYGVVLNMGRSPHAETRYYKYKYEGGENAPMPPAGGSAPDGRVTTSA
jgi:capsular exopolysaccharide synthesis family protein